MSAHNILAEFSEANHIIPDPGTGLALPVNRSGVIEITGGGTRTLGRPPKDGIELFINGACTITVTGGYNAAAATSLVVAAGSPVFLKAVTISGAFAWRQMGITDSLSVTTLAATTITAGSGVTITGSGIALAADEPATITYDSYGAVIQTPAITDTVVLNSIAGIITTVSSTLAAAARAEFTLTNSSIANGDIVIVTADTAGTGTPVAYSSKTAAGSCIIVLENKHASAALNAVVTITFVVHKLGAAA